jgi:hypothetical protein
MNKGRMNIYKPNYGDCSNNGISARFDEVIIWDTYDTEAPDNAVLIIEDICCGKPRIRAIPANINPNTWTMFGGTFIYTSNAVVPYHGIPIKLHDRIEQYPS